MVIGVAQRVAAATLLVLSGGLALPKGVSAEGPPKIEWELPGGGKVRLYGQINMGVLYYDDSVQSEVYAPIDNNNSSSRVGATYNDTIDRWNFEARVEVEYRPYSTNNLNVEHRQPDWTWVDTNFRKIEISFQNDSFGALYLGQGSMASDGTAEVDLSGTSVIAYSAVHETAAGQLFRDSADGEFGPNVKSAFTNYDGLSRKVRIRYDTPKFEGFGLRVSYGQDVLADNDTDLADIALTYENEFEVFQVEAAVAYAWQDNDIRIYDGSASVLHLPTGLNLTVAAGSRDDGTLNAGYVYGKVGLLRDIWDLGATAVSIDHYTGVDIAAAGSRSHSIGVAIVQNINDYNTELYLTYRLYDYDTVTADFHDGQAILGGARIKW